MNKGFYLLFWTGLVTLQAASIPDAISDVFTGAGEEKAFAHFVPGLISVISVGCAVPQGDLGMACGTAEATTEGFHPTSVIAPGVLGHLGAVKAQGDIFVTPGSEFGVAERVDAQAGLSFWVEVLQAGPLPPGANPREVPVIVFYELSTSSSASGGGSHAYASISVTVNGFNMGDAFNDFWDAQGSFFMGKTVKVDMTDSIPNLLLVTLYAEGSVTIGNSPSLPSPTGEFLAIADPTFQIDPNYPITTILTWHTVRILCPVLNRTACFCLGLLVWGCSCTNGGAQDAIDPKCRGL